VKGEPRQMATRKQLAHAEDIREKIRTSQLLTRLTNHGLGRLKKPMDDSQVRAALGVLKKSLPDLQSIEHRGAVDNKIHVISSKPMTIEEWIKAHGRADGAEST
jgi:hypothetical protein